MDNWIKLDNFRKIIRSHNSFSLFLRLFQNILAFISLILTLNLLNYLFIKLFVYQYLFRIIINIYFKFH